MSIECNNTTPLASKTSASALTLTSAALNDILDIATLVDLSDPLDNVNRASVTNITNALANITNQTDLSAYPSLKDRNDQGAPTYTEIADFLTSTNTNVEDLETALIDYNTTLVGGSSTNLVTSPNYIVDSSLTNSQNLNLSDTTASTSGLLSGANSSNTNIDSSSSSSTTSSTATGGAPGDALSNLNNNSAASSNNNSANNFDTGSGNSTVIGSSSDSSSTSSNNSSNGTNSSNTSSGSNSNNSSNGSTSNSAFINTGSGNSTVLGQNSNTSTLSTFDSNIGSAGGGSSALSFAGLGQVELAALAGGLNTFIPAVITKVFNDLDFYYVNNLGVSISSKLCGQFNDVMRNINSSQLIVNAGQNIVNDIVNLTEKDIKKRIESITQQLTLKTLLEQLNTIIEQLINRVKTLLIQSSSKAISVVEDLGSSAKSMQKRLARLSSNIQDFASDPNIEKIKNIVESVIATLASSFERLTPENIALLMFRLCQYVESLQSIMMAPAVKLNKIAGSVETELKALTSISKTNTKQAVKYGGIRVDSKERQSKRDEIIKTSTSVKPSQRDVDYVTRIDPSKEEINAVRDISESGLGQYITFSDQVIADDGWKNIDTSVWYALLRLSDQTQESYVVKQGTKKKSSSKAGLGAVSKTAHNSGYAIDINVSESTRDDTIVAASRAGFTCIGVYKTYLHLDLGTRRSWVAGDVNASTSEEFIGRDRTAIRDMLDTHDVDGFRKSRYI